MGLTRSSVGFHSLQNISGISKNNGETIVALVGNPNVGKSSLFNTLTGLHQHTGNWPGKTVETAIGKYVTKEGASYTFVDLPGCYSIKSHSPEEEVARNFIMSNKADIIIVVCDAMALERNLNLAIQIKEITENVIICINLIDEAYKNNLYIDTQKLGELLDTKIITTVAHKKDSVETIISSLKNYECKNVPAASPFVTYPEYIENAIQTITADKKINRVDALEIIENTPDIIAEISTKKINDDIINTISQKARIINDECVYQAPSKRQEKEHKIDKLLTGKFFGFFTMLLFLFGILWLTIFGANYPSQFLSTVFSGIETHLYNFLIYIKFPVYIADMLVYGIYHILAKIVSVMLPPMAIFFPLFTLLEDIGYLPRIAFNLDKCFKKCSACGKQALTMCMGFGCNAAGVVGCRIIDSPRERLIAIITNSFVPCNGRFPAIISIITMFFICSSNSIVSSLLSASYLFLAILIGIAMTMLVSAILSKTVLKGIPSSFTLELPHFRKPQIKKILVRSLLDRTLFVLGRAVTVAIPAGLLIWLFANITIGNTPVINYISNFFDPLGRLMGLDGVILTAFILGLPANEIVIPLILMMYMSNGVLNDASSIVELKDLLIANGWTYVTAINTILFMLMHWPCSTTCLTIKKETNSIKWTLLSIAIPTACGILICMLVNLIL